MYFIIDTFNGNVLTTNLHVCNMRGSRYISIFPGGPRHILCNFAINVNLRNVIFPRGWGLDPPDPHSHKDPLRGNTCSGTCINYKCTKKSIAVWLLYWYILFISCWSALRSLSKSLAWGVDLFSSFRVNGFDTWRLRLKTGVLMCNSWSYKDWGNYSRALFSRVDVPDLVCPSQDALALTSARCIVGQHPSPMHPPTPHPLHIHIHVPIYK